MKRGHSRPSSNDSTVPDTAPTANSTAVPLAQRLRELEPDRGRPVRSQPLPPRTISTGIAMPIRRTRCETPATTPSARARTRRPRRPRGDSRSDRSAASPRRPRPGQPSHRAAAVPTATPGSGSEATSASTAFRSARDNRHQVAKDTAAPARPPRADDGTVDQQGPWPHPRGPEQVAVRAVLDQQGTFVETLEQEIDVAAREKPRRGGSVRQAAEQGLVGCRTNPSPFGARTGTSERRSSLKVVAAARGGTPAQAAKASGVPGRRRAGSGTQLEPRIARIGRWRWHHPQCRLRGAVPPHPHAAGQGGVAQPVGRLAKRARHLAVDHPRVAQHPRHAVGQVLGQAPRRAAVGQAAEREDRRIALVDDVGAVARAPQLHERRRLPARRRRSRHARMQR